LETQIFQQEIKREWGLSMDQLALSKSYEILQAENKNQAEKIEEYDLKKKEVEIQKVTWEKANQAWEDQMQGRTGQGVGRGERTIALEKVRDDEKTKLDKLTNELNVLEKLRSSNKDLIKHKQDSVMALVKKEKPGFLDQIMMLERLSSSGKTVPKFDPATNKIVKGQQIEIYGSAFWPIWLVRLLFMIVEIAPVIFKFMIWKSSYDYMQDNVAQILEAKQGISLELIPDENNNLHKVKENYNARRIVEVAKRQNELEKENAIHAITLYAEKEREEIEKDPERFIQPDQDDKNKG
jgi:hypothetical protein